MARKGINPILDSMKIFLAGVEGGEPQTIKHHIENAFYSYYYMRKKGDTKIIGAKDSHQLVFVDSGAHSFFNEKSEEGVMSATIHIKKSKTKETPKEYFDNYVIWLKENWNHFDYYAELDIGVIVGQKKVLEWREVLKKENLYSKCVPVYHPDIMSWEDYIDMLDTCESSYIALEGDRRNRKRLPYNKLIKPAYDRGIKVHGFAMTKHSVMGTYPFYSVDSTSWLAGDMFGYVPEFANGKIRMLDVNKKKDYLKSLGTLDINLMLKPTTKKERRISNMLCGVVAYSKAQTYYTKLWETRNINWVG